MNEKSKIENVSLVYNTDKKLIYCRATINGIDHMSPSVAKPTNKLAIFIFTDYTKKNILHSSVIDCIEHGIYTTIKDNLMITESWWMGEGGNYLTMYVKINN